jgi:hypothetical protein
MIEALDFQGFYEIPGHNNYVINREGVIINRISGKILEGSINPAGYKNYRLRKDISGDTHTYGIHRLLGIVFMKPNGCIDELVINHLDANKSNNNLSNLEWTTHKGNVEHAGELGVTSKCTPISVRDVDTGLVTKYPSATECARNLGFTKDAILYRITVGEERIFPERKQYRIGHHDKNWFIPSNVEVSMLENTTSKAVLVRYLKTNKVIQYSKMSYAAEALNVALSTLSVWMTKENQPIFLGSIQVKWVTDPTPWRHVEDLEFEVGTTGRSKAVIVKNVDTNEIWVFNSASESAAACCISIATINYRLKSKGMKIFSDRCTYTYLSDCIIRNK